MWINLSVLCARYIWGLVLLAALTPLSIAYGLVELLGVGLTCFNEVVHVKRDESWLGLVVPTGYMLGICMLPIGGQSFAVQSVLAVNVALLAALKWHFWARYTSGLSSWVSLCDTGPYRLIRHPQNLLSLFSRYCFFIGFPNMWNFYIVSIASLFTVMSILAEERFLSQFPEYREYLDRVRWRLVPWVW